MKIPIISSGLKLCCGMITAILLASCATTTDLSKISFGRDESLQDSASIFFENISVENILFGNNTPSNFRKWILEVFDQAFLRVDEVFNMEEVDKSQADVKVVIDYEQTFHLFGKHGHRIALTVYGESNEKLYSRSIFTKSSNLANQANDFRNGVITSFSPIVRDLLLDEIVIRYMSLKPLRAAEEVQRKAQEKISRRNSELMLEKLSKKLEQAIEQERWEDAKNIQALIREMKPSE